MPDIVLHQALYQRPAGQAPRLRSRSPGFAEMWLADVEQMLRDFGERPAGVRCPHVVFARPAPDPGLIRGLWTLLPHASRQELWPATFAFGNALGFDALVVPCRGDDDYAGYTTEEQAADYPAGNYELALQTAAEAGDQRALD